MPTIAFTLSVSPAICSTKNFVGSMLVVTTGFAKRDKAQTAKKTIIFLIISPLKIIAKFSKMQLGCNLKYKSLNLAFSFKYSLNLLALIYAK